MVKQNIALFSEAELSRLERDWPHGLTTGQIIGLLAERDIALTESNLRKYVQLGLLPQSRRVGRGRGYHRGSQGLYPAYTMRLIPQILKSTSSGLTLAEIAPLMRNRVALLSVNARMTVLLIGLPDDLRARWAKLRERFEKISQRLAAG